MIADAVVVSAHDVVLNGKAPGNTTIMIWHGDNVSPYEVTVEPDLSQIQNQLKASFPAEQIDVSSSKTAIILTGVVSDAQVAREAAAIASVHAASVVNLLQAPPPDNRQVMLQVKFASVDRTSLSQFGLNLFSTNNKLVGSATTQQFPFPRIGQLQLSNGPDGRPLLGNQTVSVTDLLNIFAFRPDINVGATLRLLQQQNLLQILAEPNLVTVSGHEASFIAGGEFPFPVISSTGSGAQAAPVVTIQFRPFGVRLNFTPVVDSSGVIHLKVRPEVSALDFANALTIQGFLIPAISTRSAETEVDLREGETLRNCRFNRQSCDGSDEQDSGNWRSADPGASVPHAKSREGEYRTAGADHAEFREAPCRGPAAAADSVPRRFPWIGHAARPGGKRRLRSWVQEGINDAG